VITRYFLAVSVVVSASETWALPPSVVLSEVMYDPLGSEHHDEFVELVNASETARVDLAGWCLGDADEVDDLQGTGGGMVLAPGQRGLVLDASYFGQSTTYDSMRTTALMLTIDDRAFGRAGWSNSSEEAVILCDAHGDTVGFLVYTPEGRPGYSLEKIDPLGGDAPDNWALSRVQGGTPGAANSTASVQVAGGAAVEIATEPDPFSDQVEIEYRLATAPAVVNVTIFNVEGQVVRRLLTAAPSGASGKVSWHGRDDDGRAVPIGLYVILVEASAEGRVARAKKVIARQNHP